jgi:hypothetical protein
LKIWKIQPTGKNVALTTDDLEVIDKHFIGQPMSEWWKPIELETYKKGKYIDYFDFMNGIPIFSKQLVELLAPHIKDRVEFLPAKHANHDVFMVNILVADNVVDFNKSIVVKSVNGTIARFNDIYFLPDRVINYSIFKALERNTGDVYVNESFVRLINDSKIKGFEFQEVWDSGFTEDIQQTMQEKYERLLIEIESHHGPTYNWEKAVRFIHSGKSMRSGAWKIQKDNKGDLQILILKDDCQYHLLETHYIPPAMLFAEWHETDKTDI